jgi:hypothetical protein
MIKLNDSEEVTWVEDGVCACDNCGAFATTPDKIEHYPNCKAGESKRWEEIYSEEGLWTRT